MENNTETADNVLNYEFITKDKKVISISIEDTEVNPKFKIKGPKEIISQAIGGIGEDNETEAWATEKELDTEAKRAFAMLEVLKIAKL
jgi:hypothetical protein